MLLVPRSRFGLLFGLTQKDLDRASERFRILMQKDFSLEAERTQNDVTWRFSTRFVKRTLDVVLSGVTLLLLAPSMAVIAISIWLDSPGPALYRQKRVGKDGREFWMLKFRSMVATAEQDLDAILAQISWEQNSGILFKMREDPRVTRVGAFLRRYSLDELPQLWNVLVGDMSIVGPRPPLVREVSQHDDGVKRRLYIKPGLTGMWQVNGRSDLSWDESKRLDLYYMENWSLTGDLVIMWRTLRALARPIGDY